ncbi:homeobox-leucine zipper protein ATHB-15 [Trifolium repens]|nr:homeobox-leucine zipper protein ATHB-15 [Trifolium repens]
MLLEPWSVPEARPLYDSSMLLAQRTTMAALHRLRQISQKVSQPSVTGWGRRPAAALRALSQRLSKGFTEVVNGFTNDGWSMLESDGIDDVTLVVNSSPNKMMGLNLGYTNGFPSNVPPAILLRFMREHRSEWADTSIDAYSAAAIKAGPCSLPEARAGGYGGQFMEVIKLENMGYFRDDMTMPAL